MRESEEVMEGQDTGDGKQLDGLEHLAGDMENLRCLWGIQQKLLFGRTSRALF